MPDAHEHRHLTGEDLAALLLERPGVLVRRLHQIHSAMFAEECAIFGVTPVQYSLLSLVAASPGLDQGGAAAALRLDRFTTADVIKRLVAARLLRVAAGMDRRTRRLQLTPDGEDVLAAMQPSALRAHDRLVAPLAPRERAALLRMLKRLVDRHAALGASAPKVR